MIPKIGKLHILQQGKGNIIYSLIRYVFNRLHTKRFGTGKKKTFNDILNEHQLCSISLFLLMKTEYLTP